MDTFYATVSADVTSGNYTRQESRRLWTCAENAERAKAYLISHFLDEFPASTVGVISVAIDAIESNLEHNPALHQWWIKIGGGVIDLMGNEHNIEECFYVYAAEEEEAIEMAADLWIEYMLEDGFEQGRVTHAEVLHCWDDEEEE